MPSNQVNDDILRLVVGFIAAPLLDPLEEEHLEFEQTSPGLVVARLKKLWATEGHLAVCARVSKQFHTLSVELLYRERRVMSGKTMLRVADISTQQRCKDRLVGWIVTVIRRPSLATLVRCISLPTISALGFKIWIIRRLFQSLETFGVSAEYLHHPDLRFDSPADSLPNPVALIVYGAYTSKTNFISPTPRPSPFLVRRVGLSRIQTLTAKDWSTTGCEPADLLLLCTITAIPPGLTTLNIENGEAVWYNLAPLLETHGASLRYLRITVDLFVGMAGLDGRTQAQPTLNTLCPHLETFGVCTDVIQFGSPGEREAVLPSGKWLYPRLLRDGLPNLRHFELSRGCFLAVIRKGVRATASLLTAAGFVKALYDGGLLPSLERVTLHGCSFDRPLFKSPSAPTWHDVRLLQVDGVVVFDGDGRKWVQPTAASSSRS